MVTPGMMAQCFGRTQKVIVVVVSNVRMALSSACWKDKVTVAGRLYRECREIDWVPDFRQ